MTDPAAKLQRIQARIDFLSGLAHPQEQAQAQVQEEEQTAAAVDAATAQHLDELAKDVAKDNAQEVTDQGQWKQKDVNGHPYYVCKARIKFTRSGSITTQIVAFVIDANNVDGGGVWTISTQALDQFLAGDDSILKELKDRDNLDVK
jgi:hypothetical protein